jgi:formate hydrogenlyase subunit 3/multisubunit Na+/H+ antiporter MnhD subunit
MDYKNIFIFDPLSQLMGFFILFFTFLIFIYSLQAIKLRRLEYYSLFFLTAISSLGVVFSRNLISIAILWGFLGFTLFKLINLYSDSNKEAAAAAKKTFIIIGGSDGFLLLGFLIYIFLTANQLLQGEYLIIKDSLSLCSFLFIAAGCFAKAGCMPFHTWVPQTAQTAEVPVVAYLPASLDKLLGIYLLIRAVKDIFILDNTAKVILIVVGALTIIFAVMMALVQHNLKRLLGYHAVSQVGYMVLGIGCATPLGIAAGLFHMINNAIYKSCLFLCAGNVERKNKTTELIELGGLAKLMPVTFGLTLIASFSISGIPPFNGFVSKWMIYQGLIDFINSTQIYGVKIIAILSLVIALLGSALTLASFLKRNAAVFLGDVKREAREVKLLFLFSPAILSALCIIFGIFAYSTILPFIKSASGNFMLSGFWQPALAAGLAIVGLIIGVIIFSLTKKQPRKSPSFYGGQDLTANALNIEDFYTNIKEIKILKIIYNLAEEKLFDFYEICKATAFSFTKFLRYLHNGVLSSYLTWCLLGMLGLFYIFLKIK